jgi:hypothetical protein
MAYVGGKRQRLIKDNMRLQIESGLEALGWLDEDRPHKPVRVIADQIEPNEEISPNLVAVIIEDFSFESMGIGQDDSLEENRINTFVEIFAENNAIGQHLTGDVLDLLRGKFTQINDDTCLEVLDLGHEDTPVIFYCEYEDFEVQKNRSWDLPFNKYWWTIAVDIVDTYRDDRD